MSKKILFCAWLILASFFSLAIGVIDFVQYQEYKKNAQTANATLAVKGVAPEDKLVINGEEKYKYTLKFQPETGAAVIVSPYITKALADKLLSDGQLPLIYLSNRPNRIIFSPDEFSQGFGWMGLGVVLSIASVFALRLFRAEVSKIK